MRIGQGGEGELPAGGVGGEPAGVGVGGRQEQQEAVAGAQDAGGQGDDAADELAQAQVRQARAGQELAAFPPVEQVGGERGEQEERLQAAEAGDQRPFSWRASSASLSQPSMVWRAS